MGQFDRKKTKIYFYKILLVIAVLVLFEEAEHTVPKSRQIRVSHREKKSTPAWCIFGTEMIPQ